MPHLKNNVNLAVILYQLPGLRTCGYFSIRLCTWCVVKQGDIFYKNVRHFHHPSLCICDHGLALFIDSEEEQCTGTIRISRNELGIECIYTNVEPEHQIRTDFVNRKIAGDGTLRNWPKLNCD